MSAASQLVRVRDAVGARIKEALPAFDVAGHHGRFSDDELRKFGVAAPAVRVAILAMGEPEGSGEGYVDYVLTIGIYVCTKDGATLGDRDGSALAAVETIVLLSLRSSWGLRDICKPARSATAQNLYSAAGLADGLAMWAVDLRQPVRLCEPEEDGAALERVFVGVAPNVGRDHRDDYVQVAGPPL